MTEYRMGKPRTITDKPLKKPKPNEPLELLGKLHKAEDTETRRVLVSQSMGEMFYIWGNECKPWKPWFSYEGNMDMMYLGGRYEQNVFCKECHRIPSQCVCRLTKEEFK